MRSKIGSIQGVGGYRYEDTTGFRFTDQFRRRRRQRKTG